MSVQITGRATVDDVAMVRDFIMLPFMLTMCQRSKEALRLTPNLFNKQFEQFITLVMDGITRDLNTLKKEMKVRQIKVWDDGVQDGILYHKFVCRGYNERFGIVRETLRSEISVKMARYAEAVLRPKQ